MVYTGEIVHTGEMVHYVDMVHTVEMVHTGEMVHKRAVQKTFFPQNSIRQCLLVDPWAKLQPQIISVQNSSI